MARMHGSKARLYVHDRNISDRVRSVSLPMEADTADVSALASTDREFVGGQTGATLSLEGILDPAVGKIEELLQAQLGNVVNVLYLPQGDAIGNYGYGLAGMLHSREVGTDIGDAGTVTAEILSDVTAERAQVLHNLTAETVTGDSAGQDHGALSADGGAGYLIVTAKAGAAPTLDVKIQHSVDNAVWADLITFAQKVAEGSERVTVTGTVNRWTRATRTIGGAGPSFTFVAAFNRD